MAGFSKLEAPDRRTGSLLERPARAGLDRNLSSPESSSPDPSKSYKTSDPLLDPDRSPARRPLRPRFQANLAWDPSRPGPGAAQQDRPAGKIGGPEFH